METLIQSIAMYVVTLLFTYLLGAFASMAYKEFSFISLLIDIWKIKTDFLQTSVRLIRSLVIFILGITGALLTFVIVAMTHISYFDQWWMLFIEGIIYLSIAYAGARTSDLLHKFINL